MNWYPFLNDKNESKLALNMHSCLHTCFLLPFPLILILLFLSRFACANHVMFVFPFRCFIMVLSNSQCYYFVNVGIYIFLQISTWVERSAVSCRKSEGFGSNRCCDWSSSHCIDYRKKKIPGEEPWRSIYQKQIHEASEVLRKFVHENDFVWHEKIPSGDELPLAEGNKIVGFIPYSPKRWERTLAFQMPM